MVLSLATATKTLMVVLEISLGGTGITTIDMQMDNTGCARLERQVDTDIARGFETTNTYGMIGDMWGAGGGAIFRASDYETTCVDITFDDDYTPIQER